MTDGGRATALHYAAKAGFVKTIEVLLDHGADPDFGDDNGLTPLDWLAREGSARLTGTGSCVFTSRGSAADAERLAARVPDRWMSFVARGLDTSPVHERLRQRERRT